MAGFKDRLVGKIAKLAEGTKKISMLSVGTQAPDFEVEAHDGTTVKLSDYSGKKVLLWFYPRADTPG
jgi:peroxiredoxin Q/BCP